MQLIIDLEYDCRHLEGKSYKVKVVLSIHGVKYNMSLLDFTAATEIIRIREEVFDKRW